MATELLIQEQEIEEMATGENGEIASILNGYLFNHVYPNQLGRLFDGRTTFEMQPAATKREPDLAFVAAYRLPNRVRDVVKLAPDLAVEIVSPNDKFFEVEEKALEYLKSGVRLVWVISPLSKAVFVYHPDVEVPDVIGLSDELDGENVIPGFKLKVSALF